MDKIKDYDYNKFSIIELFPKYRELKVEYEKIEKAFNVEKKEKARYKNLCKTKNAEILDKDIEIEQLKEEIIKLKRRRRKNENNRFIK